MGNSPKKGNATEVEFKAIHKAVMESKQAAINSSRAEAFSGTGNPGLPPKEGEFVYTPFGPGVVEEYRPETESYVVLQSWRLDQGARVRGYFNTASVFKVDGDKRIPADTLFAHILPSGLRVQSNYGHGTIESYDVNHGNYKVSLDWTLDGGAHAVVYAQPDILRPEIAARPGEHVLTPYGTGTMLSVRADGTHVVHLNQLQGSAIGYLNPATVERKLRAVVGQKVQTHYGAGVVVRYRREDDIYIVSLEFALAYLNGDAIVGPLQGDVKQAPAGTASDCDIM